MREPGRGKRLARIVGKSTVGNGCGVVSVCRVYSLSLFGIDALPVEVEVDVGAGLPGFSIVGLPDAAVQEARERVRVAISNSGYKFPTKKVL